MHPEQPIILAGRGGSGTRLLSQFALAGGVFLGNELNESGDSVEWMELIYEMVVQVGGQRNLPDSERLASKLREQGRKILARAGVRPGSPWGFKLPEVMLLLPTVARAFPDLRIVHLVRHPVSSSLRRTHITSRLRNPIGEVVLPAAYRYAGRPVRALTADEAYLHNAITWVYQVGRAAEYGRKVLTPSSYLELRFEDVCASPHRSFESFLSFLNLPRARLPASFRIDSDRTNPWDPGDTRLRRIWNICGPVARSLGYPEDP